MKKKNSNYIYIGLLVVLVLIYIGIKLGNVSPDKNFDSRSLAVDTTKVTKIFISSQSAPSGVTVEKVNGGWIVKGDSMQAEADINTVTNMLAELANLDIESVVASSPDKWKDYELTDSAATEVKVYDEKGNVLKDLYIGKLRFKRMKQAYGMGSNGVPYTFVREGNNDETYLVKGMLAITFNRNFTNLRNQMIAKLVKDKVNKISFTYPADSSFTLVKKDSIWWINGKDTADMNKVDSYLNMVGWLSDSHFDDKFKPTQDAIYTIKYEGNDFTPITIRAYQKDSMNYVINSTYNPKAYFVTIKEHLINRIYKPKSFFVKHKSK